jgi:hypothetical protein
MMVMWSGERRDIDLNLSEVTVYKRRGITISKRGQQRNPCGKTVRIGTGVPYAEEIADFKLDFPVNV